MAKIAGKNLEFWWDSKEYPVQSVSLSEEFDTLDSTDTSTQSDGKDFIVGRANRSITVDMLLFTPDGALKNSGTLTAGKKYRVNAKSTVLTQYEVGQLFVANGTEVMSSNDNVYPLGDPLSGKNMSFSFNGANVPITDIDLSTSYDTEDATDTSTAGDASETIVGRGERASKVTVIARSEAVDLLTTNPQYQTAVITLATGQTITGSAIPISKSVNDEASGFAKIEYNFKWLGAPTEVNTGLPTNIEKQFKIILARGTSTHKSYIGNAIITSKTITGAVKDLIKVSLTLQVNGAITYAVAN